MQKVEAVACLAEEKHWFDGEEAGPRWLCRKAEDNQRKRGSR
jgi:hypothetical protein